MGKSKEITPALTSFSSMNYFFLRTVTGKMNVENVNEELKGFIKAIANKYYTIDRNMHSEILNELKEGSYFDGLSHEAIKELLQDGIENITGATYPNVVDFYLTMYDIAQKEQRG